MTARKIVEANNTGNISVARGRKRKRGDLIMVAESPRLLVVDDNENNRFTLTLLLEVEGFTNVTVAEDGEEALAKMASQPFDLVLLDLMMPRLNGYQVLEELRARGKLGDPPVIMITALDELESTVRCIELGAEDYLPKPFNPILLKARIRASLEKKKLRDEVKSHRDRMETELQEARTLQLGLCPTGFPAPTAERPFDIAAVMEPAREVGGDLYDVFERSDGSLCFLVGDVSDKGAAAALFMARTRDIIRLVAETPMAGAGCLPGPGDILGRANELLCTANATFMFVTLFVGVLDRKDGTLQYGNAGHNDPYRLSSGGTLQPLAGVKGRPLGIRRDTRYAVERLSLQPGDALFAFTDGITEAMDGAGEQYSQGRLEEILLRHPAASASQIIDSVMGDLRRFTSGTPLADDTTAVAIRLVNSE